MDSDELKKWKNEFHFQHSSRESSSSDSSIFLEEEDDDQTKKLTILRKNITKIPLKKKKYCNITNDLRLKLIDAVETRGEKIKHAAKKLCINYSSAKSIFQVYKREGRSSKKSFKKRNIRNYRLPNFTMECEANNENRERSDPTTTQKSHLLHFNKLPNLSLPTDLSSQKKELLTQSKKKLPQSNLNSKPAKVLEDVQSVKNLSAMSTTSGDTSSEGIPENYSAKSHHLSNLTQKSAFLSGSVMAWQQPVAPIIQTPQNVSYPPNGVSNSGLKASGIISPEQVVQNQQPGYNNMLIPVYSTGFNQPNFQIPNQILPQGTPNFNISNNIALANLSQTQKINNNLTDPYQVQAPYVMAPYINVANPSQLQQMQQMGSFPVMQQAIVYMVPTPHQNIIQLNQNQQQQQFISNQNTGNIQLLPGAQVQANNQKLMSYPQAGQMPIPIQQMQMAQQQSQHSAYLLQQAKLQQSQQEMIQETNRLLKQMQEEMEKIKMNIPRQDYERAKRLDNSTGLEKVPQETPLVTKLVHL